jgi:hypothetical protein
LVNCRGVETNFRETYPQLGEKSSALFSTQFESGRRGIVIKSLTMKKIFAFLLSIWIPVYLLFGLLASCEKSTIDEVSTLNDPRPASNELVKSNVIGTWQLKEFYQDIGNGDGNWTTAPNAEQVSFSSTGDFSSNANFPLADRNFNKYKILDSVRIELYSTQTEDKATFYYKRESATSLLFNPLCRENCSRRYTLVQ